MALSTTDTIKSGDGFTLLDAPAISTQYTVFFQGDVAITIGYGQTVQAADSGIVQTTELRVSAADLATFDAGFTAAEAAIRDIIEDYVKDYLEGIAPGVTITKT